VLCCEHVSSKAGLVLLLLAVAAAALMQQSELLLVRLCQWSCKQHTIFCRIIHSTNACSRHSRHCCISTTRQGSSVAAWHVLRCAAALLPLWWVTDILLLLLPLLLQQQTLEASAAAERSAAAQCVHARGGSR
jgi:hypothetical protein